MTDQSRRIDQAGLDTAVRLARPRPQRAWLEREQRFASARPAMDQDGKQDTAVRGVQRAVRSGAWW